MHRLYALLNGRLADLTHADTDTAAQALAQAAAVFVCHPDPSQTVAYYPATGRWLRGGQTVAETDLPDGWDLPDGRRLLRDGLRLVPGDSDIPAAESGE
ncbi:MAG: hypothetical protein DIU70_003695 [Bacillota bacterium]|nr:MAG: hypothetical protein DIU70_00815 [Bacillota bacterium]